MAQIDIGFCTDKNNKHAYYLVNKLLPLNSEYHSPHSGDQRV